MLHALTRECFDVTAVVPECYGAYRSAVLDAIDFFLRRLTPLRLRDVVHAQAALPLDAAPADRLVTLMHQCPALHKLGQVIARHRKLEPGFRAKLQELEMREPRTNVATLWPIIQHELGEAIERFAIVPGRTPLAEASVAVVMPLSWSGGEGVFKVMRPGVETMLDEDLTILAELADHLDARGDLPTIEYRRTFDDVAELLRHEVCFDEERANLAAAATAMRRNDGVIVPALLPFGGEHVTAMQRVHGVRVTQCASVHRRALARRMARALVVGTLLGTQTDGLFHADPHAGNLFADEAGHLIALDWSLVGRLTDADRRLLIELYVSAAWRDEQAMTDAIVAMAIESPGVRRIAPVVRSWIDGHRLEPLPRFTDLLQLTDDLALAGVRFPHRLMLFRKAVFTLDGVVGDVCPQVTLSQLVEAAVLERVLMWEMPWRLLLPVASRATPSGLSTVDLWRLGAAATTGLIDSLSRVGRAPNRGSGAVVS